MPKKRPEPFWREQTRCYYVQIGKKQVRLSPDEKEAWRLYHELMARPDTKPAPIPSSSQLAVEVMDAFLEWVRLNRAERTFAWYKENIQRLVDRIPGDIAVDELKPYHVSNAMAAFPDWSNNTKNDFITAVKRVFNWALDEERIERNPIARLKKPAREAREMAISPTEYVTIMTAIREGAFRDLLELAWETGARVQELRKIEARFFEPEAGRIVFPPAKAKGKKYHRVVYLPDRAKEIIARLAATRPSGPIVLNADGNAWTKDAINCNFTRLATKLGVKYHLSAFRKGFATEGLKAGVDTVTMAHLLGHRDPAMISRVYGQVQSDPVHMANAARKAVKKREDAAG
jgi:integrase